MPSQSVLNTVTGQQISQYIYIIIIIFFFVKYTPIFRGSYNAKNVWGTGMLRPVLTLKVVSDVRNVESCCL